MQSRRAEKMVQPAEREEMLAEEAGASLESEIAALREAIAGVRRQMSIEGYDGDAAELAKKGSLLARLSDSVVRAVLAQQKLSAGDDRMSRVLAEMDHLMRILGET
jgi:hypothetical protein